MAGKGLHFQMTNLIEIITQDYQRFPHDQHYGIYAEDVYFQDPLNRFSGVDRYQKMIGFLGKFFQGINLTLHHITQAPPEMIRTDWTLEMVAPLPWHPPLRIRGYSELTVNGEQKIIRHCDYWHGSPWKVLLQIFPRFS